MISVEFEEVPTIADGTVMSMRVRPIDVARAIATMSGFAPGLSLPRRLARRATIALEALVHLKIVDNGSGDRGLAVVGTADMERSDRAALSHRFGVGFARLIAERPPCELSDLYYLDGLVSQGVVRLKPALGMAQRHPDMAGLDARRQWNVLEAKGHSTLRPSRAHCARAKLQASGVELSNHEGRRLPVAMRLASVTALTGVPVSALFTDPPADRPGSSYALDPERLIRHYYEPVRDMVRRFGRGMVGVSGAHGFVQGPLPGTNISFVAHRKIIESVEDPEALLVVRAELKEEWQRIRADTDEAEDADLSIGLDGLGLLTRNRDFSDLQIS